jgi:hypothetical protein
VLPQQVQEGSNVDERLDDHIVERAEIIQGSEHAECVGVYSNEICVGMKRAWESY